MQEPVGLGEQGHALWVAIMEEFELRVDEVRVLEQACRTLDLIERMAGELENDPLIVDGPQNKPVANPIAAELRQNRALFPRLMAALHLPDAEGLDRSEVMRSLANRRWKKGA